ncbi:MAG TPA: four helix bundle protein [Methylomirabilota bacterium]|nr:four helix bundle protein [Methylomirabilota bacterium]
MNYQEWIQSVPSVISGDTLGKMQGWRDVVSLAQDRRMIGLSDQLVRALGSIGANIAEGYSRSSVKDQARFYEYALGSARESRDWYYKTRYVLGEPLVGDRLELLTKVIRLLLVMVSNQRKSLIKENEEEYGNNPAYASRFVAGAQICQIQNIF